MPVREKKVMMIDLAKLNGTKAQIFLTKIIYQSLVGYTFADFLPNTLRILVALLAA